MPPMSARRLAALAVVVGLAAPATAPAATPTRVIGTGTARSCTSAAVVAAVRAGGQIDFSCGPGPVTIRMGATAKVLNTRREVVIDGGGRITLSGAGKRRILYMDTCDRAQRFTTSHCQDQATPRLTVRNLTFTRGNSTGEDFDGGGGGAIFVRGGRLRIEHSTFVANRCDPEGPDRAIGHGANPARSGTPGGGSGGAIYNDGNRFALSITGSRLTGDHANEGGGAIFFVSNDRTGTLAIADSVLLRNPNDGFHTAGLPGIYYLGAGRPAIDHSVLV